MIVYDAHAHVHTVEETVLRQERGIRTMISAGNPEQARIAFETAKEYPMHGVTCGLHPWYAAEFSPEAMRRFMEKTPVVGEIGMDSVWCDVPMDIQERAFIRQLDMADEMKKPVVLHTKGCEEKIAGIIGKYDVPFIVHWYSGDEDALKRYLDMDCYFTIGQDVEINPNVAEVAKTVPANRILFETDGMEAVFWALGEMPVQSLPAVLENSVRTAARLRGDDPEYLAECANDNYIRLFGINI